MHPLFMHVQDNYTCVLNSPIQLDSNYSLHRLVFQHDHVDIADDLRKNLELWLTRRNILPMVPKIGIIDMEQHKILFVDILAECNDQIVFILFFHTDKRATHHQKARMREYANQIKKNTVNVFHFEPEIKVLNIYGAAQLASFSV